MTTSMTTSESVAEAVDQAVVWVNGEGFVERVVTLVIANV